MLHVAYSTDWRLLVLQYASPDVRMHEVCGQSITQRPEHLQGDSPVFGERCYYLFRRSSEFRVNSLYSELYTLYKYFISFQRHLGESEPSVETSSLSPPPKCEMHQLFTFFPYFVYLTFRYRLLNLKGAAAAASIASSEAQRKWIASFRDVSLQGRFDYYFYYYYKLSSSCGSGSHGARGDDLKRRRPQRE